MVCNRNAHFLSGRQEYWEARDKESWKMGISLGTVDLAIWWQARAQGKKGLVKKCPLGGWMRNCKNTILLYSVLSCVLFHKVLVPLHYSQAFKTVCCAQWLFVRSNEGRGGCTEHGKRRRVREGKVSREQEVRRGRKSGQEVSKVTTDSRGKPRSLGEQAAHPPVPGLGAHTISSGC